MYLKATGNDRDGESWKTRIDNLTSACKNYNDKK